MSPPSNQVGIRSQESLSDGTASGLLPIALSPTPEAVEAGVRKALAVLQSTPPAQAADMGGALDALVGEVLRTVLNWIGGSRKDELRDCRQRLLGLAAHDDALTDALVALTPVQRFGIAVVGVVPSLIDAALTTDNLPRYISFFGKSRRKPWFRALSYIVGSPRPLSAVDLRDARFFNSAQAAGYALVAMKDAGLIEECPSGGSAAWYRATHFGRDAVARITANREHEKRHRKSLERVTTGGLAAADDSADQSDAPEEGQPAPVVAPATVAVGNESDRFGDTVLALTYPAKPVQPPRDAAEH